MMPGMDGVANAYTHPVIARVFFFGSVPSEKEKKGDLFSFEENKQTNKQTNKANQ